MAPVKIMTVQEPQHTKSNSSLTRKWVTDNYSNYDCDHSDSDDKQIIDKVIDKEIWSL